jgi:hypothetical protein
MSGYSKSLSSLMRECAFDLAAKAAGVVLASTLLYYTWSYIWQGFVAVLHLLAYGGGWPFTVLCAVVSLVAIFCKCVCQKYESDAHIKSKHNDRIIRRLVHLCYACFFSSSVLALAWMAWIVMNDASGREGYLSFTAFFVFMGWYFLGGWAFAKTPSAK